MGLFDYPSTPVVSGALLLVVTALCGLLASTRSDRVKRVALSAIPLVQLLVVVGMIYYSGGIMTSLLVLLLVPAFSAMFISRPFTLWVSLFAIVLFMLMSVGDQAEWWSFVERAGYTDGQLAAEKVLRIVLLLAITVSGVFLVLIHHMRRVYRLLEARDEDTFSLAQSADEVMARAIDTLDANSSTDARLILLEGREVIQRMTDKLTDDGVPVARILNVASNHSCNTCSTRIGRLSFYYGIPASQRTARLMGTARNDVHCVPCHQNRGDDCMVCAVWATPG